MQKMNNQNKMKMNNQNIEKNNTTENINNQQNKNTKSKNQITNIIDKAVKKLEKLGNNINIDVKKICEYIEDTTPENIKIIELYDYIADYCSSLSSFDTDYTKLASIIIVKKLHLMITHKFSDFIELSYNKNIYIKNKSNIDENTFEYIKAHHIELLKMIKELKITKNKKMTNAIEKISNESEIMKKNKSLISDIVYNFVKENEEEINKIIKKDRDYGYSYFGIKTLERSYLLKRDIDDNKKIIIETPQFLLMRVALGIHVNDKNEDNITKLKNVYETYENLSKKYFIHATPTLFNASSNYPQMSSCFLLSTEDSIDAIFGSTIYQSACISKFAGGIGIDISSLRSYGSKISTTNGESGGIIPFIRVFNEVARCVNQGGKRQGSIALYLQPWHADIFEFCEIRKNTKNDTDKARDMFIGLWIPDLFMKRVWKDDVWSLMCPNICTGLVTTYGEEFEKLYIKYENEKKFKKQIKARELFTHIINCQIETGIPYMLYKDAANNKSNQNHLGTIRCSNLCVHGDTLILSNKGHIKISDFVNQFITVWNGSDWSTVLIQQTGSNKNLIRINLSNGSYLDCTPEHNFYIKHNNNTIKVKAADLKINDILINMTSLPLIEYNDDETEQIYDPYTLGLLCGYKSSNINNISISLDSPDLFKVPHKVSIKNRIKWLEGLVDGNGKIIKKNNCEILIFENINLDFLSSLKLMLQTLGIDSFITLDKSKNIYLLSIYPQDIHKLFDLDFNPKILIFSKDTNFIFEETNIHVISITNSYENCDTFCFTEPKKHLGVFNGILTGQCSEIIQYSDINETATCNLASICLPRFVTKKMEFDFIKFEEIARICVRNMNKIIDYNWYPTEQSRNSNMKHRPMGIGIQGLADLYNILELPFESEKAEELNKKIFETLYFACLDESCKLAKKYGKTYDSFKGSHFSKGELQFDLWEKFSNSNYKFSSLMGFDWNKLKSDIINFGTLNSLLTAQMPTATTSQILGNSESIEPNISNIYVKKTLSGEFCIINEHLVDSLKNLGLWNLSIRNKIFLANGSVQNIDDIPQHIKDIYKTAFEIKQKSIINQSIHRGPFIDQSQSLNLFIDESNISVVSSIHFYSWNNGLKTGLYYLRSKPAFDPIKFGININELENNNTASNPSQLSITSSNKKNKIPSWAICESCSS